MKELVPEGSGNTEIFKALSELRNNLPLLINYDKHAEISNPKNFLTPYGQDFNYALRLVDKRGIVRGVNKAFCELFSVEDRDIVGKLYNVIYDKNSWEDLDEILALFNKDLLKLNICYFFEKLIILTNDRSLHIEGINTFIKSCGKADKTSDTFLLTLLREIPDGKRFLDSDLQKFDSLLNVSPDAIMTGNLYGLIERWNKGAEDLYGYSAQEMLGKPVSTLFLAEKSEITKVIKQIRDGSRIEEFETINKTKNGAILNVLYRVSPIRNSIGKLMGITIIGRDISDQKKEATIMHQNAEMYRTLIETSPDGILMIGLNGDILMSNKQVANTLGYNSIEEMQVSKIFSFFTPKDKRRIFRDTRSLIETGILKNLEYTLIRKDRGIIPIEISASLLLDMMGKPFAILGILRDISERKKAEYELRNSELRFRSIWENSNDGMRLTDQEGIIVAVNKAYCSLIGLKEEQLVGRPFTTIYTEEDCRDPVSELSLYRQVFLSKNIKQNIQTDFKYYRPNQIVLIESYSFIELEAGKSLLLGIYHDITEMRRNEEELSNAEKFAAIGKQAAFLSHEIKSPLASIKMNLEMLFKNMPLSGNKERSLLIVQKEIKRLEAILKNVLLYSRDLNLAFYPVDLEKLVENIHDLMRPILIKQNIKFSNNLRNIRVKGDFRNLQTMFLHMIENSIESMPAGGLIDISSRLKENSTVSVLLKDTGCGIANDTKIFDPFVTTKPSGTGLGLAIAGNIIKQHGGSVKLISSRVGETIFEITFKDNIMK
jgi:two-component system, sporulation sensor kinase A